MKAGDNKEFWQRTAKSYGPFMKHSGKLYDTICERIPWEDLNGSFQSIIFKSDKQHCSAEALRRCVIWRQV